MSTITKRSVRRAAVTFEGSGKKRGVNYGASWQTKRFTLLRARPLTSPATMPDSLLVGAIAAVQRAMAALKAQRKARRGSRP